MADVIIIVILVILIIIGISSTIKHFKGEGGCCGGGSSVKVKRKRIARIDQKVHIQILVSLSCTMCPELVTAAQKIATLNPLVAAEVYDINHFGEKKQKYNVMSVPCLVINEDKISFGKKNIEQILDLI